MRAFPALLLPVLLAASPAIAQQAVDTSADSVTIGAGGVYLPDYEGSDSYRFAAAPGAIGRIGGHAFVVAGNSAWMSLIPSDDRVGWSVQAGPIAALNFNRSSPKGIDDPRVRALGKRPMALEVGGYAGIGRTGVVTSDYDRLSMSISYRKGVTGAHRGGILEPSISYVTPLSMKAIAAVSVSGERVTRDYAATYFDVDAAGSLASGLPQYRTRGGWKAYSVSLLGGHALTGDLLHGWKIAGGINYRRLLGDFADSPLVAVAGSRDQWLGAVGLAYTF